MKHIEYGMEYFKESSSFMSKWADKETCEACKALLITPDFLLNNKISRDVMEKVVSTICVTLGIEGGEKSVCKGAVDTMADQLLPAITGGILSPQRVCDEYFHFCQDPVIKELSAESFVERVLKNKPESLKANTFVDDLYKEIAADTKPRKIIRSI